MPNLSSNADAILRKMNQRAVAVKRELEAAARRIAPIVAGEAKTILQSEVYNVPIPLKARSDRALSARSKLRAKTTKGGHGKWSRTGNLKRLETATADGVDVLMRNSAEYAAARNALGGPNPPNKSGRRSGEQRSQAGTPAAQQSKTRSVQWHSQAIVNQRTVILKIRREAVIQALSKP